MKQFKFEYCLQEVANRLAKQSVAALAALYGPHEDTTEDDERMRVALHALLTPYLCEKLAGEDTHEVGSEKM